MIRLSALLPLLLACSAPVPQVTRAPGPTVIFEAGLGDGASVWEGVALPPGLGRFAWSRGGYEGQAFWPGDGDGRRSAEEVRVRLEEALGQAGLKPPFLLVGHSIGAIYTLDFARAHPDQVAGIVLVDPRLPGFTARCKAEGLDGCEIPPLLRLALSRPQLLELDGMALSEAALRDPGAARDIPLTILLAQKPGLGEDPRWRAVWADHARGFARGFAEARVIEVASGHYIQTAAPDAVTAAIAGLAP